jgi:hypothetical protein
MAAENKIDLLIAAHTKEAEAGLARVRDRFQAIIPTTEKAAANFRAASNALDVKPMRLVSQEINALREHYQRLSASGLLSQRELAQAADNLRIKTAQLREQYTATNAAMREGSTIAGNWATRIKQVAAAYVGYQTVTTVIRGIVEATKEAEQSQFNLQASVKAASREFGNTGTLDFWQGKVKEMSAALKVYSEADVANAISRTVDMTKRLGMSSAQMEELIKRSADLSAGKTDLQGGIERVTAALRGEAESAEFLGLTLNETLVKAWHETHNAHGRAWKDLTDLEKAQVRFNVFLEQSAEMQGRAAESANTFSGALAMVKTEVSNAIANNKNLAASLSGVANIIRENADEIGDMASAIATAIGETIKFVVENKSLIATLAGAGGVIVAVNSAVSALGSLHSVMMLIKKAQIASTFVSVGGGMATMAGASVGAKAALSTVATSTSGAATGLAVLGKSANLAKLSVAGLLVVVGQWTASKLGELATVTYGWAKANGEAADAADRLAVSEAKLAEKVLAAQESTGVNIQGITHLNQLLREGKIVRDELTGQYLTLEQAQAKAAAAAEMEAAAEAKRAASYADVVAIVERAGAAYGDLSEETINAAGHQQVLTDALSRAKESGKVAADSVENLGDAYFDAALALEKLSAGQDGYEAALKAKLDAEKDYVDAVESMREQAMQAMESRNNEELRALKQKHELQLMAEKERLEAGFIDQAEYDHLKLQAEENLANAVLDMRDDLVEKSAELYGQDSAEYRNAAADKIDAEIALKKAQQQTRVAWEETIGTGAAARKSAGDFSESLRAVGRAGQEGGEQAAAAMENFSSATEEATEQQKKLTEEQKKQARAKYFGEQYSGIQNQIASFKTLEEATDWASQIVTAKNGRAYTNKDLMTMGGAGIAGQSAFTRSANKYAEQLYIKKLNELSKTTPQPGAATQKTMTVNLKSGGQTVAATLPEADAGRLLEVLRQAGMVTA